MSEPRGAGTAGGLLFTAVLLVLAYLAVTVIAGFVRWIIGTAILVVVVVLLVKVVSRR
ncbi:hypothetical protein BH23ACT9_BH23ACT9_30510 [soil metagenome]